MAKDILIISEETGFMMNSFIKSFADNGIEVETLKPSELSGYTVGDGEKPYIFILYAGGYLKDDNGKGFLELLSSICKEKCRTICAAGNSDEIKYIKENILSSFISCEIEKPFSASMLTELIKQHINTDKNSNSTRKSILLVDDDILFLKMTMKWLSEYYDVSLAKSGEQVLSYLTSNAPDLIMLDYNMPNMSGAQVMQEIRSKAPCPDVPIMFLTGRTDKDTIEEVMALKPQGYIPKASAQSEILKAINDLFEKQAQVK